ncbi:MAG TPA: hydrogenase nickel incorporation protein HypB [Dehalococcoidales bacterium]|nr:hydrogenase nickel incorporation protein HypB [Dehalococcoidales bacterium]
MEVTVLKNIMNANDQLAADNQKLLDKHKILGINVMSSPGAGKTTLLIETIRRLKTKFRIAVIEADIASSIDADKISQENVSAIQINTGGQCHIDANMVRSALDKLPLEKLDLIFVENVGNLICPADFKIGTHKNVMLLSVPEGHDKPFKYPLIFITSEAVIISKMDYLPLSDFNLQVFKETVSGMNAGGKILPVSARTGEGMAEWVSWLECQLGRCK